MNELVVARFKENIDWIPSTANWKVTVYNKHDGTNLLPNVGRESHTYFHHIVTNYDNLADWTIFTQGSPIEHPGHNGKSALESILKLLQSADLPFESGFVPLVQVCLPISSFTDPLEVIKVANEIGISASSVKGYFFPNGIFVVSKNVILKHPKEFYDKCLTLLDASNNPPEGHCFERLWTTIFDAVPVSKTSDLKILSVKFGHDQKWVDATEQVQYMCSLENGMCTKNIGWGVVDPVPYVCKTTVIEYSGNGKTTRIYAKDNEIVTVNGTENETTKPLSYYVNLIREAPIEELQDAEKLEKLICRCGLQETHHHNGLPFGGLRLHQLPSQFSKYLLSVSKMPIESYMEIGVLHLGTFIFTVEYLNRFYPVNKAVAVDPNKPLVWDEYKHLNSNIELLQMFSTSSDFAEYVSNNSFDLCFIDGDHSSEVSFSDFKLCFPKSNIVAFHDICDNWQPGVCHTWNRVKALNPTASYAEFTDQYPHRPNCYEAWYGIGTITSSAS